MQQLAQKQISSAKHPVNKLLYWGVLFGIIFIAIALISSTFYQQPIQDTLKGYFIEEYVSLHPEAESLDKEAILENIPEEEKEALLYTSMLNMPFVSFLLVALALINGYFILKYYISVKDHGVWLDAEQFPKVHALTEKLSKQLGLEKTPDLFILTGDSDVRVACAHGARDYVAVPVSIFEHCVENNDMKTLSFIIGHELGHHKLGHRSFHYAFISIVMHVLPPLKYTIGNPLSRSEEYGADKIAALVSGDHEGKSLLVLSGSSSYYKTVNLTRYVDKQVKRRSHWSIFGNFFNEFPNYSWRIAALIQEKHGELFWPRNWFEKYNKKHQLK